MQKQLLLLPLIMFAATSALAGTAKVVDLPFQNVALMSDNHNGVYFEYNMKSKPVQEVVCDLKNSYKATMEYRSKGQLIAVGTPAKFILTSKGEDSTDDGEDSSHQANQMHVDAKGAIRITDWKHGTPPTLSCHYEFDDNPKP